MISIFYIICIAWPFISNSESKKLWGVDYLVLKPFEYPELYEYVPAIRHSYWIHTEFNFTSDIQDFKTHMSKVEKNAIKNERKILKNAFTSGNYLVFTSGNYLEFPVIPT